MGIVRGPSAGLMSVPLGVASERSQSIFPQRSIAFEPSLRIAQRSGAERAVVDSAVDRARDQPRALHHPEMLRDRRQGHVERLGYIRHLARPLGLPVDQNTTGSVREGMEDQVELIVSRRILGG